MDKGSVKSESTYKFALDGALVHQSEVYVSEKEWVLVDVYYDLLVSLIDSTSCLLSLLVRFILLIFFIICIFKCLEVSRMFVGPDHFKVPATQYFNVGSASIIVHFRNCGDDYLFQNFDGRRLD